MRKTDCTDILKALADRNRMRLVKTLLTRSLTVNDLAAALTLSQYNVSKHLRVLRYAGIVRVQSDGTRRAYSIAPEFRGQVAQGKHSVDFGCCTFYFDRIKT